MVILEKIKKVSNFYQFFTKFKKKSIKLSDYIDPNNILFLNSKNRTEVIKEMIEAWNIEDSNYKKKFHHKILQREKIVSTGIGLGVAIPHAKLNNFDDFFILVGIKKLNKINWPSIDNIPIRIIFMIGGPDNKQSEYLQLLSNLTVAIRDEKLRKNLLNSNSENEIYNLLLEY